MSANTNIKEGGKGYPFGSVKCLMVEGDNGEYYPWYPETDRQLESLSVDKNGSYRASDRGVYGWNHVSANVPQTDSVTGKDPETGEEKTVTVDPETGELVETVVPVEIRVTTLPTKTEYTEGETIDYSGIVVHAYSSTGEDMGAVPFGELVFPTSKAGEGWEDEWSDGGGLNALQIAYTQHWGVDWRGQDYSVYVSQILGVDPDDGASAMLKGSGPARLFVTRYNGHNYAARLAGDSNFDYTCYYPERETYQYDGGGSTSYQTTLNQFTLAMWEDKITELPESTVDPTTVDPANLHATQSIPAQWQRPGDGAILETSFNITVTGGE